MELTTRIQGPVAVIGDVHGQTDKLLSLLEKLQKLPDYDERWLVFIGDFVDRGPDSKGAVDLFLNVARKHPKTTAICGNPLGCAVGAAVLDVVNTPEVLAGVKARHQRFKAELERIGERYGLFEQVRGAGLLIGAVLAPAWKGRAKDVQLAAEAQGLLVLQAGPDVIRLAPSLVIGEAEISEGLARFERAAASLAQP